MENKYVIEFINYLSVNKNYSELTCKSYKKDLSEFVNFLNGDDLLKLNESTIKAYFSFLYEKHNKSSTICRKISSLKSFYNYLSDFHNTNKNIVDKIKYPKKDKKLPKFVYYDELISLLEHSSEGKNGKRNKAIMEVLYATGVRVSELVGIKISDIDFTNMTIRIMGKGSYERIVYFGEYALDAINDYINTERQELLKGRTSEYLFLSNRIDKLDERMVRYIIDKIIKTSSIKMNISPHTLRHTFATHLLNEGCDIRSVQTMLGHKNISTTEIYTHVSDEMLRHVYLTSHPRSGKK